MVVKPVKKAKSTIGWFSEDEVVDVLAIRNDAQRNLLLLWSKLQNAVALFPSADFHIIDNRLCPLWRVALDQNGNVEIAIEKWLIDGFWERYHEDEKDAVNTFQTGMRFIISSFEK
jgi:hypothetical protein